MNAMKDIIDLEAVGWDVEDGRRRASGGLEEKCLGIFTGDSRVKVIEGYIANDGRVVITCPTHRALKRVIVLDCLETSKSVEYASQGSDVGCSYLVVALKGLYESVSKNIGGPNRMRPTSKLVMIQTVAITKSNGAESRAWSQWLILQSVWP
jgi:hypothetical protein